MVLACLRLATILATMKDVIGNFRMSDVIDAFISTFVGKAKQFPFLKSTQPVRRGSNPNNINADHISAAGTSPQSSKQTLSIKQDRKPNLFNKKSPARPLKESSWIEEI